MTSTLAPDVRVPGTEQLPASIGRFVVREEIGRGSNGIVYAATDPVLGRDVAIKAVPLTPQYPGQENVEAGFLQEAKIAAGLNHPSIVTVFDAGKTESLAYIAMERLKGSDLHHWLAHNRHMAAANAAALIARVADAVHFAHRHGLIHRDIKPSNIFLGRDMKPKVLDFGIALAQKQQARNTEEPKKLIGTPNYMSPEQALARPLDARSDVFSIGAILYELVTGRRAFDGANVDEILTKVVKIDPPNVTSWRPEISPVLGEIILRALAKEPANRYQTAALLRNDLAAFAGRPVGPATSPPAQTLSAAAVKRQWPGTAALISTGIAFAALSLTFVLWFTKGHGDSTPGKPALTVNPAVPGNPAAGTPAAPGLAGASRPEDAHPGTTAPATAARAAAPTAPAAASAPVPARPAGTPAAGAAGNRPHPASSAPPAPAPVPPEPGILSLAVVPWGQVLVDGADAGVSPPLNRLSLAPGMHSIELRNGETPAYVTQVRIEAGQTLLLQHRF